MKIGLYTIPTSNMIFRKMDGEWTALHSIASNNRKEKWDYYSTTKGKKIDGRVIETHSNRECLTYCRSIAKVIWGVPDNVELYAEDTKDIKKGERICKKKSR